MDENKENITGRDNEYQNEQKEYDQKVEELNGEIGVEINTNRDLPPVKYYDKEHSTPVEYQDHNEVTEKPPAPKKGSFSAGFFIAAGAWAACAVLTAAIFLLIQFTKARGGNLGLISFIGIQYAIAGALWLPIAIIAGGMTKKGFFRDTMWLVGAAAAITLLVLGGCDGLLSSF